MPLESTRQRRIPSVAEIEGNFLESVLPVRALAHLTSRRQMSSVRLSEAFVSWVRAIQAHHKETIGWVRSIENLPKQHIHAVLIAAIPLDCVYAAQRWQTMIAPHYSEAAKVEPYRGNLCGLGYALKGLNGHMEEIQYSENISAFVSGSGKSLFSTSSAQRRQIRRIQSRIPRTAQKAAFPHCPCSLSDYECLTCGMHGIEESIARQIQ